MFTGINEKTLNILNWCVKTTANDSFNCNGKYEKYILCYTHRLQVQYAAK